MERAIRCERGPKGPMNPPRPGLYARNALRRFQLYSLSTRMTLRRSTRSVPRRDK